MLTAGMNSKADYY